MHEFWIGGNDCDPGYKNIRDLAEGPPVEIRKQLENYWDELQPYLDAELREEFAKQPDARFWEMYLSARVLRAGKHVVPRTNRPRNGPDILIEDENGRIWIEAVCFGRGATSNPDKVPEMVFDGSAQAVPVNEIELRISTVFSKKSKTFARYLETGLVEPEDRTLIAINPGKLSAETTEDSRSSPFCVLYPLGDQYVRFFKDSDHTENGHHYRTHIEKKSGVKVPSGMFADQQHCHISGAIWSKTHLGNHFYGQSDLTFFPNSTPIAPLAQGWMDWEGEWGVTVVEDSQVTMTKLI